MLSKLELSRRSIWTYFVAQLAGLDVLKKDMEEKRSRILIVHVHIYGSSVRSSTTHAAIAIISESMEENLPKNMELSTKFMTIAVIAQWE